MGKSAVARYSFVNAKLRARIGKIEESKLVEDMVRSGSLVEAIQVLRGTVFNELAEIYDTTGDLQQVEFALLRREIRLHQEVAGYLTGAPSSFMGTLLEQVETENLKSALRLWYSNNIKHKSINYRAGYLIGTKIVHQIDWPAIINSTRWDTLLQALNETPYYEIVSSFSRDNLSEEGLFYLEMQLDKLWYRRILKEAKKLDGRDRELVVKLFTEEIDLENVLTLVRSGWYYKLPAEKIVGLLIEGGTLEGDVRKFLDTPEAERNPSQLLRHRFPSLAQETEEIATRFAQLRGSEHSDSQRGQELGMGVVAQQTMRIEAYLEKNQQEEYLEILRGYPFSIGTVLSYLFLSRRQHARIRTVLNGKAFGWTEKQIRGLQG